MKHLHNIRLVLLFELFTVIKRPTIITALIAPPIFIILFIWMLMWAVDFIDFGDDLSEPPLPIGIVDDTDQITDFTSISPTLFIDLPNTDIAQTAYETGEIQGYYHISATYPYSNQIIYYTTEDAKDEEAYTALKYLLATNLLHPTTPVQQILDPVDKMIKVNVGAGETKATAYSSATQGGFGFGISIFVWLTIMIGSGFIVNGLDQEKENRMLEILLLSIHPLELLIGKLVGLGIVALAHTISWVTIGGTLLWLLAILPDDFQWPSITWPQGILIVWITLTSYVMYSTLFATASALTPNAKESAKYTAVLTTPLFITIFICPILITNPTGRLAIFLTLIPITSPIILPLRLMIVSVPAWQWLFSLGSMVVIIIGMMWFASKVFRLRILLVGQRISLGMIWQMLRN